MNYKYSDDAFFGYTGVKIPMLFKFSISGKRVIPFFNAGFSPLFLIKNDYVHINETEYLSKDIIITQDNKMAITTQELIVAAGAGVKVRVMNKIFLNIEGRFEYGPGLFKVNHLVNSEFRENSKQVLVLVGLNF